MPAKDPSPSISTVEPRRSPKAKAGALRRFGENVRAEREAQDLSQEQLAERAELDRTYISGVERGVRNLSILSAARIAKALKTTVAALCAGIEK